MGIFKLAFVAVVSFMIKLQVVDLKGGEKVCDNKPVKCWSSESNLPQVAPNQTCYTLNNVSLCNCSVTTGKSLILEGSFYYLIHVLNY